MGTGRILIADCDGAVLFWLIGWLDCRSTNGWRWLLAHRRTDMHRPIFRDTRKTEKGGKSKYTNWQRLRVGFMDLWGVFWLIKRSPFPIKILDNEVIKHKKDKEQKWIK